MFGFRRRDEMLDQIMIKVNSISDMQDVFFNDLKVFQKNHNEIVKHCIDLKMEVSSVKNKLSGIIDHLHQTTSYLEEMKNKHIAMARFDEKLLGKLVSDEALNEHLKEFTSKQNLIFKYIDELEKLISNVELVLEKQLPTKSLRLPKKKKATNEAS